MTFPIDSIVGSSQLLWLVSLLVGFGFGFVLERAGFGRSTKLAAQFYLTDMTVFKVMFGAIVTAGLGLVLFQGVGLVDAEALAREAASTTLVGPMVLGGLLLGAGFITSGYCPGTSMVATASGNVDGLVALIGVIGGGLLFGEAYPWVADFAHSGDLGVTFVPDVLGLSRGVVMGLVTAMALALFVGAEAVERWANARRARRAATADAGRDSPPAPALDAPAPGALGLRRGVFAGLSAAAVLGFLPLGASAPDHTAERHAQVVDAETLARRLVEEPWSLRVVDLRSRDAWVEARVPDSESMPLEELDSLALNHVLDSRDLVLVGEAGDPALPLLAQSCAYPHIPDSAVEYGGRVFALAGGFAGWRQYALDAPEPPAGTNTAERAAFAFQSALQGYLTGAQIQAPPPIMPTRAVNVTRSGGGGCN